MLESLKFYSVPPNVEFVVDDIEHAAGWDHPDDKFDYIHIRNALHSIHDRKTLVERIYKYARACDCPSSGRCEAQLLI
jgi:hypothetical protein